MEIEDIDNIVLGNGDLPTTNVDDNDLEIPESDEILDHDGQKEKRDVNIDSHEDSSEGKQEGSSVEGDTESQEEDSTTKIQGMEKKIKRFQNQAAKERRLKNEILKKHQALEAEHQKAIEYSYQADVASVNGETGRIEANLEIAKDKLKRALIDGDVEGQADATVVISELMTKKRDLDNYRIQQQYYKPQPKASDTRNTQEYASDDEYYNVDADENEHRTDFIKRNKWMDQNSINYNPSMVEEIGHVANQLNSEFKRIGRPELIWGEEYFNKLDNYVKEKFYNMKPDSTKSRIQNTSRISPVKNSSSMKMPPLSREQRAMLGAIPGATDEDFMKAWSDVRQEVDYSIKNREKG